MLRLHRACVPLVLIFAPTLAIAQSADDKAAARSLGVEGGAALDKKDYKTASDRYGRAVRIFEDAKAAVPPTLLLGQARADAGLGHYLSSQEAYNRLTRMVLPADAPPVFVQAIADAKKEIEVGATHIGSVVITVAGCDRPVVTIDDKPISSVMLGIKKPIDPGEHIVKASAEGCKDGQVKFVVADGGSAPVSVVLVKQGAVATVTDPGPKPVAADPNPKPIAADPVPKPVAGTTLGQAGTQPGGDAVDSPPSSLHKPLAIAGFAVGGLGLVAGAVTGGLAMSKRSALTKLCVNADGSCPASAQADLDSYHLMGTLSTVGFIVGGVGAAAGLVFLLTAPKAAAAKTAWVMPTFGPNGFGAVGRF